VATTGSHWEQAEAAADRMLNPAAFRAGLTEIRANPATSTEHEFEVAESGQVIRRLTSPVHDESGRRIGRIVVLREMTGERRLQRMKDEFVATVTHELRTPLTSIAGYVELLLDGEGGPVTDDQHKFLHVIERNSERLLHLVSDLLFVARVEAGMLELELEWLELDTLVEDAVEAARPTAESHQLSLELATGDVPALDGDRARLGQLVDNLLWNAIKLTPAGGTISVKTGAGAGVAFLTGLRERADSRSGLDRSLRRAALSRAPVDQAAGLRCGCLRSALDPLDVTGGVRLRPLLATPPRRKTVDTPNFGLETTRAIPSSPGGRAPILGKSWLDGG
jgi:signal transduction histidine kinase